MPQAAIPWIIGVGTAAGVGTQLYGAKKASDAAKSAAATQSASADKALALQEKMWGQSQKNLQPWINTGTEAITSLGGLMGLGGGGGGGAAPTTPTAPTTPNALSAWFATTPDQAYTASPYTRRAVKNYLYDPQNNPDPSQMGPLAPEGGGEQYKTGYTMMRAPTGAYSYVMDAKVPHYQQLGAEVVQ